MHERSQQSEFCCQCAVHSATFFWTLRWLQRATQRTVDKVNHYDCGSHYEIIFASSSSGEVMSFTFSHVTDLKQNSKLAVIKVQSTV